MLQAVYSDSRMVFTNISVGWTGSLHDAWIFKRSSPSSFLENDPDQQYHLLGDLAYPLSSKLLVPYKDKGHLSAQQIH